MNEAIKQTKKEYFKAWRAKNKDKVAMHNKNYWEKKTLKKIQEQIEPDTTKGGCVQMDFKIMYRMTLVEELNNLIEKLKAAGFSIHDNEDFEFTVDHIRYSPAQDKLLINFKEMQNI